MNIQKIGTILFITALQSCAASVPVQNMENQGSTVSTSETASEDKKPTDNNIKEESDTNNNMPEEEINTGTPNQQKLLVNKISTPAVISPLFSLQNSSKFAFLSSENLNIYDGALTSAGFKSEVLVTNPKIAAFGNNYILAAENFSVNSLASPLPSSTEIYSISEQGIQNKKTFAQHTLLDLSIDRNGNGYLLLSDERTPFRNPENLSKNRAKVSLFTAKVENGIVGNELTLLNTLPIDNMGTRRVAVGKVDSKGNGFAVYFTDESYDIAHFSALNPTTTEKLFESKTRLLEFFVKENNNQTFIFWSIFQNKQTQVHLKQMSDTFIGMPVKKYTLNGLAERNSVGNFNFPRNWDINIDSDGNGNIAFGYLNHDGERHLKITKIKDFSTSEEYSFPTENEVISVILPENNLPGYFLSSRCTEATCSQFTEKDKIELKSFELR